ncbi:hypothetical protein [Leptothermofonsia sp. ETS-13]|uniref:hypothetical protein n=1 Tax=Leptothermofonsia sp. ETS-13 TaxID=3035696 RepID=UPI003BA15AD8
MKSSFTWAISPSLSLAIAAALSSIPLTAQSVRADDCSSVSFIQTPDGKCHDLSYLTVLGRSRQNLEDASKLYAETIQIRQPLPVTYVTETTVTDRSTTSVITFDTYYPIPEELEENLEILQRVNSNLRQKAATNEAVERWAFRRQRQVMNGVSKSFVNSPPVYSYPMQVCYEVCSW